MESEFSEKGERVDWDRILLEICELVPDLLKAEAKKSFFTRTIDEIKAEVSTDGDGVILNISFEGGGFQKIEVISDESMVYFSDPVSRKKESLGLEDYSPEQVAYVIATFMLLELNTLFQL